MPGIVQYIQQKKEKHDYKGNYCNNIQTIRYQEPALHVWYFLIRYYYLSTSLKVLPMQIETLSTSSCKELNCNDPCTFTLRLTRIHIHGLPVIVHGALQLLCDLPSLQPCMGIFWLQGCQPATDSQTG